MNKCHSNLNWLNDTTPAINDTNLNYMDGCIDTIDDRVVTMDSTKLEAGNISTVIKNVSVNDSTGVFTFTRYDNSTFTVDTMLEKVVTNFGFDETTQKLTITLEDGTTKQVDLSSFIKETEVEDSDTVALSLVNHKLKATIKVNSITDAEMQTQYLTDCQSARNTATTAATASNTTKLQSEGYALGTQNGVEVDSSSPYYHNNAKYYSGRASGSSLSALTDVNLSSVSDGQALVYDAENEVWVNGDVEAGGSGVITTNLFNPTLATTTKNGLTCTRNSDGTYTVSGTASSTSVFDLGFIYNLSTNTYKILGIPSGGSVGSTYGFGIFNSQQSTYNYSVSNSAEINYNASTDTYLDICLIIRNGQVCNNLVFKPMLTTNLSATYDDFVAYTGDTGSINGDVAQLRHSVGDAWNSTTTYAVGSYCIYGNTLWKCKAQNVNTVPSEGTYWTSVTVASEMSEYLPRVIHLSSIFTDTLPHIVKIGKTVIISGYFMNATSGSVTVSQNGVLMSGLPVPKKNIGTTARFSHTSEDVAIIVRTDGNLYFNHAAYTFSNYQGILIYCFAYETN